MSAGPPRSRGAQVSAPGVPAGNITMDPQAEADADPPSMAAGRRPWVLPARTSPQDRLGVPRMASGWARGSKVETEQGGEAAPSVLQLPLGHRSHPNPAWEGLTALGGGKLAPQSPSLRRAALPPSGLRHSPCASASPFFAITTWGDLKTFQTYCWKLIKSSNFFLFFFFFLVNQ